MRRVSQISVLAVLAFVGVVDRPAFAQSKACSLVLNISTLGEEGQARQIKNARAFVVRKNTRRRIPATLISGSPRFPGLRTGTYRLTILKRGFKTTTRNLDFSCSAMNSKIEFEVSLEPTAGFSESTSTSTTNIPPVRRGVTTIIGTAEPGGSNGEGRNDRAPARIPNSISGGVLNGKAIALPKPAYPAIARQAHVSGTVVVQVTIDEKGNVISAYAVSGHPLLKAACVEAARGARFSPTKLMGRPVKVTGVITYNFVAQ
ncbi:MAG TPA: energy transducer TonB [Pyrinomonadaceae bacterium]|jgi:TonB family protein|nr:energy transducer TonB [Pyrinomonadaceae bacterium]